MRVGVLGWKGPPAKTWLPYKFDYCFHPLLRVKLCHRCAIPARINQYHYLILKNQVSIPISISIFQISEVDTNFNINTQIFTFNTNINTNTSVLIIQYKYQYQYLGFENSISISIPNSSKFNVNFNTKVFSCKTLNAKSNQTLYGVKYKPMSKKKFGGQSDLFRE